MPARLLFTRGRIVTEAGEFHGGLLVEDGRILELVHGEPSIAADQVIDLEGKTVLPGIVDDHVHFNEPGREHWEGYYTGSMAAAAGGVTTFIEMPLNATPPSINRANLLNKLAAVKDKAVVDYALWGGLVDNNLDELEGLHQEGVVGFKGFMSNSGVDFARIDDDVLYAGLLKSAELGNLVAVHAENEYVTRFLGNRMRAQGRTDRASWSQSRPPAAELEALERAVYWAGVTGGNLHVVHTTIADGIGAAYSARVNDGISVTVETCPHYLYFDESDFERLGPLAKCAPPIRERDEVEALWACVLAGMVDTIASDHSPCPWSDKEPGMEDIWQAWGGISGVQSTLGVLLTEGFHKRGLPLTDLVRMTSANPARIFGLYPRKGCLLPGSDADFVVVDLDTEWELTTDELLSKHKFSPYAGSRFKGKVERTVVRGETVFGDGRILAQAGYGRYVRRGTPAGR